MRKSASKANVSRSTLKTIAELVAAALDGGDLSLFEKYSPGMFPQTFPQSLRDQAAIVGALKPGHVRQAPRTNAVANLRRLLPDILAGALRLADCIEAAFPDTQQARRLEQCGYTAYYASAAGKNWESAQKMGQNMSVFMQSQSAELRKGGVMPADFPGEFDQLLSEFNSEYEKLKKAKTELTPASNANTAQMSALETMLSKVFKSARVIFRNDPVKRSFYTMSHFASTLRPGTTAGIRGQFFDAVTKLPISGGRVFTDYHNLEVLTNENGRFFLDGLTEGEFTLNFEANGYGPHTIEKVKTRKGKKTSLKPIGLQPLPAEPVSDVGNDKSLF